MNKFYLLLSSCFLSLSFFAQLPNDDCFGAIDLGALPTPAGCNGPNGTGLGTPVTNSLSNVGAVAENPYTALVNCQGSGVNMSSPAADVWYSFTATGNNVDVSIAGLNTPNVGLYYGNCGALTPFGCGVGNAGNLSVNFDQLVIGQVYYLQISGGDANDQGPFDLTLQNNIGCDDCLVSANLTVNPAPTNGTYLSGTPVTFCYTITEWEQTNTNWFQGIEIAFGAGWDQSSLTNLQPAAVCGGSGAFDWYNSITSSQTGNTYGNGFYIDLDGDGDPGNNFGDNCSGNVNWEFCWTITAGSCPPLSNGADLGLVINSLADGEAGSWSNLACQDDPQYTFSSSLACCLPPLLTSIDEICLGDNTGSIDATAQGTDGPWDFVITDDASGNVVLTDNNNNSGNASISNLAPGTYTVTVTDDNGCVSSASVTLAAGPVCNNCTMNGITAIMTNCYNTPFLQYDMTGEVSFTDPPLTGQLIVQNCFGQQEVFNAPFTSPQSYSFTGLPQDGQLCSMTAYFTDDPACTISGDIQAPPPITFFSSNCTIGGGAVDGTIEFTNPNNAGGTLVISISDGTNTIDTVINPPFNSPQNWSVSGLNPAANPYVISYYFSDFQSCAQQQTINCGCSADAGTNTVTQTGNGINNYILCENDQVVISTNNDFSYPDDVGPINGFTYQPALAYLIYTCPPTPGVFPGNDPCFYTIVNNTNDITQINDGSSFYDVFGGSATFPSQTLYYTPITLYHYDPVAGNYIVNSNCWDIGDITQVTFLSPITSTITPDCQTASVDVVISGGYPELFGGNFTASNLQPSTASFANTVIANGGTITINGLQNGDFYSFDVVDDNGCPHTISGGPFVGLPVASAGLDDQVCVLDYGLNATPSFGAGAWSGSGTFSPSANDPNATVTVASAGTYTFTWTEDNGGGCVSSDDVIVTFSNLSYVDNVVQSTCGNADGEINLTASNGIAPYQYSIDGGASFQANGSFLNLFSGTYNVVIQDDIGCQVSATVTITDQGGPVINSTIANDVLCQGFCDGTIAINATGATQFSIDNGVTFQSINTFNGLCVGTYDIVVQDNFGCQAIDQVVINQPAILSSTIIGVDVLCFGQCTGEINIAAQGGTGPYQYSIDGINFSLNSNNNGLCAGNYSVIVQDANGCQTTPQPITISEPPLLSMTLGVTDETCFGACDGMINTIPAGGTGPGTYTYSWTPTIGNVPLATNLCVGAYSLTVTDANGCTITADTVINGPQAVNINNIVEVDELCGGDCTGSLTVNATGATQYSLDGVNFQASNVFSNLCAGSYIVYVSDASGCIASTNASISGPPAVNIQAFSDTTICIGGSAQLNAICSGGVGGYSYAWDNGDATQSISVSPSLDQIYCVTGTDANGCSSGQVCLTVSVNPAINLLAFSDQTICMGDAASISALATGGDGGPYNYNWDQGLGAGQNHTVSPNATTVYTVTASDGCETPSANASVTITVSPIPTVSFTADTLEGCMPVTTTFSSLNVPAGSQCLWNFGDGGVSTDCGPVSYTYSMPGCWDVDLSVTTPEGCVTGFSQAQYICVYDYPTASFTFGPQPTTVLNTTIDFTNTSIDADSYLWTFDTDGAGSTSSAINPTYTFPNDDQGLYEVCLDAMNDFGCLSSICQTVVINEEFLVYVPNAFTPDDGNTINNIFYPIVTGVEVLDYEFYVFNRWGELIYESYYPGEGWDGRYQGVMSPQDAYVWKLIVVDQAFNKTHEYVGHVILLK